MQSEPTKAVLYAAKSTEDKRGSIPTQLEDCRAMGDREGWRVLGEYADEAASAWSGDRGPELTKAMEHAEREKAVLVVQHSDRLARGDGVKARHLGEVYFWALKAGVTLRAVEDDSTFTNPLLTFAMGERNAEDSRRKSESVKKGMKRRRERGLHHGGPCSYGYRHRDVTLDGKPTGPLTPYEPEATIVRRIFEEFVSGRSQLAVTRGLRADGIKTRKGKQWHQGTVRNILDNEKYAGLVGDVRGVHQAIISEETWAKVCQLREAKARTHARGRPPAGQHLFRKGMLKCDCGASMVPRTDRNRREGPYEVYRCYGRHQNPDSCSMEPVKRETVDVAVYAYFETLGLDVEATRRQFAESKGQKLAEVRSLLKGAETDAQRASESLARVRRHYQEGRLEPEDWADQRPQLTEELEAAKAQVERLRRQASQVERDGALGDAEQEMLTRLTEIRRAIAGEVTDANGVDAVRAALSRMFECFVLHIDRKPYVREAKYGVGNPEMVKDGYAIELVPREAAVEGYKNAFDPILRRQPLQQAENNYAVGFTR